MRRWLGTVLLFIYFSFHKNPIKHNVHKIQITMTYALTTDQSNTFNRENCQHISESPANKVLNGIISKALLWIKCLCDSHKQLATKHKNRWRRARDLCSCNLKPCPQKLYQVIWNARHIVHVDDLGGHGFSTVGARPHPHRLTLSFALTTREGCLELLAEFPWK